MKNNNSLFASLQTFNIETTCLLFDWAECFEEAAFDYCCRGDTFWIGRKHFEMEEMGGQEVVG